MLLFKKKDLLVVISKSGDTVQFTKPLKDILKYQHRYNYKFKMYETGKVTVSDDYIIEGETLTVLFGSASVAYTSEGATYTEGSGGGSGDSGESYFFLKVEYRYDLTLDDVGYFSSATYDEIQSNIRNLKGVLFDNQQGGYTASAVGWGTNERTGAFMAWFYSNNGYKGYISITTSNIISFNEAT